MTSPIYVAIDTPDMDRARTIAELVAIARRLKID